MKEGEYVRTYQVPGIRLNTHIHVIMCDTDESAYRIHCRTE